MPKFQLHLLGSSSSPHAGDADIEAFYQSLLTGSGGDPAKAARNIWQQSCCRRRIQHDVLVSPIAQDCNV